MKRLIVLFSAALMLLGFTGCRDGYYDRDDRRSSYYGRRVYVRDHDNRYYRNYPSRRSTYYRSSGYYRPHGYYGPRYYGPRRSITIYR